MNPELVHMVALFRGLRGGTIAEIRSEGDRLDFRVTIPFPEEPLTFIVVLKGVQYFTFQPIRNESTEIRRLAELNRFQIRIMGAEVRGERAVVECGHIGATDGARLNARAEEMLVFSEEFDTMRAAELEALHRN